MYFELELFTKAVTKYKSEEAKNLLVKLIKETSYFSRGRFLAPNEQTYLILENEDPTKFFSDEKRILSKQINKSVLEIIRHDNKRWDKK